MTIARTTCLECGTPFDKGASSSRRFCGKRCCNKAYKRRGRHGEPRLRKSTLAPTLSAADMAWVAGIVEGEGCVMINRKVRKGVRYSYPGIKVGMTDGDVVRQLEVVTGLGFVTGPYSPPSRGDYKPHYEWSVTRVDEALTVMGMIWPRLGLRRRQQFRAAMEEFRGSRILD